MGKKWMTDETLVVVKIGLIDDYEIRIGKLHQELNEAKAAKEPEEKVMVIESKVGRPINQMGVCTDPDKREFRIEHHYCSGQDSGVTIIKAATESEALKKFFEKYHAQSRWRLYGRAL